MNAPIDPDAVVLPYGSSELAMSWTRALHAGFEAVGQPVHLVRLETHDDVLSLVGRPSAGLVVGPREVSITVDGRPLFDLVPSPLLYFSGDSVFYDLVAFPRLAAFLAAAHHDPRLVVGQCEAGSFDVFGQGPDGVFPTSALFVPHGAFARLEAHPGGPRRRRLCVFGHYGEELGRREIGDQLAAYVLGRAPAVLGPTARRTLVDLVLDPDAPVAPGAALRACAGLAPVDLMSMPVLQFLCGLDSWVKRARRAAAVEQLVGHPVDFYGKGWRERFGDTPGFEYHGPVPHPEMGRLFRTHAGVVNLTTNWSHGLHERVYTALAAGVPVLTPDNPSLAARHLPQGLVHRYDERRPHLGDAIATVLAEAGPDLPQPCPDVVVHHGWADRAARFLRRRDGRDLEPAPSPGPLRLDELAHAVLE